MPTSKKVLPVIVICQFCCTSLWFAGNAIMSDLLVSFRLTPTALAHLTSSVQFGFIVGTLVFALFSIADRFSPSRVFFVCALFGAIFNLGISFPGNGLVSLLMLRFFTGFFLAGIYPVGMKIAADYYDKGLGKALGFLVGALVMGTAFPHLLKGFTSGLPWRTVLMITAALAGMGGLLMLLLVPDGPFRKRSQTPDFSAFFKVFQQKEFRSAAFGYFGHMWELYAFWAFVPVMLTFYSELHADAQINIPISAFLVIGLGGLACVAGGFLSEQLGTQRTAAIALLLSGACCLLSPLIFQVGNSFFFIIFLIFWGWVVVADSPLFSTLVAQNSRAETKGTALTIVNCVGFAITIVSIQLLNMLQDQINLQYLFLVLAPGPAFGLWTLLHRKKEIQ